MLVEVRSPAPEVQQPHNRGTGLANDLKHDPVARRGIFRFRPIHTQVTIAILGKARLVMFDYLDVFLWRSGRRSQLNSPLR